MRSVRLVLLLDVVAAGAVVAALLLVVGMPLAARGALRPAVLAAVIGAGAALFVALSAGLLFRAVARPVDRILAAAGRLAPGDALPLLQPPGEGAGPGLSRAAVAFERVLVALVEDRARLADKVREVEAANRALAATRESLHRSERLATVGQLAAGVAHEIGNPLGAVTGYAELARARLASTGGDPDARDYLARIAAEATRIDRIVRDLLDFARASPPERVPVEVGAAVDAAVRLAEVQPRFRGVRVVRALPPALPPVRADERRLAQVLLNLLLNAADAMEGEGELRIDAEAVAGRVRLRVADRGPGIPPEHLPRIFDPFFSTKPPGKGTGLGLAVSHGIVEALGGALSAENAPGGGAVFTLELPAAAGGAPAGEAAEEAC